MRVEYIFQANVFSPIRVETLKHPIIAIVNVHAGANVAETGRRPMRKAM